MNTVQVVIHTGHLSVDNGARFPLTHFATLAKLLDVPAEYGEYYGSDMLQIADSDWPVAQELLVEHNMLFKVEGVHSVWQNVKTAQVADRLGLPH